MRKQVRQQISKLFMASEWASPRLNVPENVPAVVKASDVDYPQLCSSYVNGKPIENVQKTGSIQFMSGYNDLYRNLTKLF